MDDLSKYPGLSRRKPSGIFYYRKGIPENLRERVGKREFLVSLETQNLGEAVSRYHNKAKEVAQRLASLEQLGAAPAQASIVANRALSPQIIKSICDIHSKNVKDADFARRASVFEEFENDKAAFWAGDLIAMPRTRYRDHLREEGDLEPMLAYCLFYEVQQRHKGLKTKLTLGDIGEFTSLADQLLSDRGIQCVGSDKLNLIKRLMQTELRALQSILDRSTDDYEETIIDGAESAPTGSNPGPLLSQVIEGWIKDRSRGAWNAKTRKDHEAALNLFLATVGDKPISSYGKGDGREFKKVLSSLPANVHKRKAYKNLKAADAARKAAKEGLPPMSAQTVNKRLTTVGGCFKWAMAHYDEATVNPVEGLPIRTNRSPRDDRAPFTIDELNTLFQAHVYTGCASERQWFLLGQLILRDSAKFWVPLIGLYSGMRLGEIIQLQVEDIKTESGIDYFHVHKEGDRTVKTAAGVRLIPIHSELIKIGFMDHVSNRKSGGTERLFPEYEMTDEGVWSDGFSKHFSRFLKKLDIKRKKNCFHSFRHSFEDACRNSGVSGQIMDALQGHTSGGMSGRYGFGYDLKTLGEAMQQVKYDGLDLGHLRG